MTFTGIPGRLWPPLVRQPVTVTNSFRYTTRETPVTRTASSSPPLVWGHRPGRRCPDRRRRRRRRRPRPGRGRRDVLRRLGLDARRTCTRPAATRATLRMTLHSSGCRGVGFDNGAIAYLRGPRGTQPVYEQWSDLRRDADRDLLRQRQRTGHLPAHPRAHRPLRQQRRAHPGPLGDHVCPGRLNRYQPTVTSRTAPRPGPRAQRAPQRTAPGRSSRRAPAARAPRPRRRSPRPAR